MEAPERAGAGSHAAWGGGATCPGQQPQGMRLVRPGSRGRRGVARVRLATALAAPGPLVDPLALDPLGLSVERWGRSTLGRRGVARSGTGPRSVRHSRPKNRLQTQRPAPAWQRGHSGSPWRRSSPCYGCAAWAPRAPWGSSAGAAPSRALHAPPGLATPRSVRRRARSGRALSWPRGPRSSWR